MLGLIFFCEVLSVQYTRNEGQGSASFAMLTLRTSSLSAEASRAEASGDDTWMDPPVPISNTVVKHPQAEGTWGATPWKTRLLPV